MRTRPRRLPSAGWSRSSNLALSTVTSGFRLELPARFVILGPNHTGRGVPLSIMSEGRWRTPLGEVAIDADLAHQLMRACPLLEADTAAHRTEHAIEVELPFLQLTRPDVKFVPIAIGTGRMLLLEELGEAVALAREKSPAVHELYKDRDKSAVRWEYLQLLINRKHEMMEPGDRAIRLVFTATPADDQAPPTPIRVIVNLTKGIVVPDAR